MIRCVKCQKESVTNIFSSYNIEYFKTMDGASYCKNCAAIIAQETNEKEKQEQVELLKITTTNSFEGYKILRYIDVESAEVVMGTGLFSELDSDLADIFGKRATSFEKKLQDSKQAAFSRLKYHAIEKGGNAIVGIDVDYTEFTNNKMGFIVSGTIVYIEPIDSV